MAFELIDTVGAANANAYGNVDEAYDYLASRVAVPEFEDHDNPEGLIVMATRIIEWYWDGRIKLKYIDKKHYIKTTHQWLGSPVSVDQALAFPRTGLKTRNGADVPSNIIPIQLKHATFELAAQLAKEDRTEDNPAAQLGVKSVKVSSIEVQFTEYAEGKPLPDAVLMMIPPQWYTQETIEPAQPGFLYLV